MRSTAIGIGNVLCGLIIIAACIPLLMRKIPMNCVYGFRFRKSFESEDLWLKINRFGAGKFIVWCSVLVGIGAYGILMPEDAAINGLLPYSPLILLVPAIETYIYSRKL